MSFMNGLSSLGQGVSQFAGAAGLEALKNDAETNRITLSNQLAGQREQTLQQGSQTFAGGESEKSRLAAVDLANQKAALEATQTRLADSLTGARESAGRQEKAALDAEAPTPEIRSAQWFAKLSPEEKQAYREEQMTKAGLPAWMIGGGDAPPSPTGTPAVYDSAGASAVPGVTGPNGAPPPSASDTNRNDKALQAVPGAAASIVKGMVDGRIAPPSSFAMSKPYWQGLISKAAEYDPTFDQTTWAGRVATRKSFAAGQDATAVTALNTALGHASRLSDQFDALNNNGGVLTPLNGAINYVEKAFGDSRQTNVQQTVDALASEARRVFAASGGGNLTELQEWQKNFPTNGSPSQQKGALTNFVELLDSRLQSLAEKYNRGMGRTDDPMTLLQPNARAAYQKLTGMEPENAVGHQMGRSAPTAAQDAEAGTSTPSDLPPLPHGFRVIQ